MQKNNQNQNVTIDKTARIFDNVTFIGSCFVGANTTIYPNSTIINSNIGANCTIKSSFIEDSQIHDNVSVGPFAHIRNSSIIENNCQIGNFVEVKKSRIGSGSKANHLAYIGDAQIGANCNIGCGVIFVNYDGKQKHKTTVGDNCFIGCNCNIISPVNIAEHTFICAGTTLTMDTQMHDFVIGRVRESVKHNYKKIKYRKSDYEY